MSAYEDKYLDAQRRLEACGGPPIPADAGLDTPFRCIKLHKTRSYRECLARQAATLPVVQAEDGAATLSKVPEPRYPPCARAPTPGVEGKSECAQGQGIARFFGVTKPARTPAARGVRPRILSGEDATRAAQLHAAGQTWRQVGAALGCSPETAARRAVFRPDRTCRVCGAQFTAEKKRGRPFEVCPECRQ